MKRFSMKQTVLAMLLLFLLAAGGISSATVVSLAIEGDQVRTGIPFRLQVNIDQVMDLYSALFDLVYDPQFFELVDINSSLSGVQPQLDLGPALNPGGGQPAPLAAAGNDQAQAGRTVVGISRHTLPAGRDLSQPAMLLDLLFVTRQEGTSRIDFDQHDLRDSNNNSIPGTTWVGIDITSVVSTNNPPTQPQVAIQPALPMTNQDLFCAIITPSTDPDGDTVTYLYQWFRDGSPTDFTSATILAADTRAGEIWMCRVTPTDGTDTGLPDSDQVQVGYVGDLDRDFRITYADLFLLSVAWDTEPGDPAFNPLADLNQDGRCDILDLLIFQNILRSGPTP